MTTAELIQKRENQKNNPVVQQTTAFQPMNTTMTDADVATQPETTPVEQPQENKVSLYDVGKTIQGSTVDKMEQMKAGNYSPITTPEYERFRNEVIAARDFGVETEEQRKKRERADLIKQGLTGLTEGLTSLANLYYTTKWAPNQKLTSQMPALQQQLYRERLERDKKLENFRAWQRAKAEKDADRAYQEKVTADARAYNDKIRKEQWAREDKKAAQDLEYKLSRDEIADQRYADETAYNRSQDAEKNKQFWANYNLQKERSDSPSTSSSRSSGSGRSSKMAVINTPKGVMDVDFGRINASTINQLYQRVPDDIKELYKPELTDDDKAIQQKMSQAVDHALQYSEGYADWLEKAGVGTYQQAPMQPKEQTGEKVDYSQFLMKGNASANAAEGANTPVQTRYSTTKVEQPSSKPSNPKTQQYPDNGSGSQFEAFFNRVDTDRANEKAKKEADMQTEIRNRESELRSLRGTINQYQKELDQLNSISVPNAENEIKKRGLVGSDARELRSLVKEYGKKKENLQKEIKELLAKEKRLNKEYAELYPYKK